MNDITKKKSSTVSKKEKVIGSIIARSVSPENRKKIIKMVETKAFERGLIVTVIEK